MTYVRGTLSGVSAVFVALLAPGLVWAIRNDKATGLAAVGAGVLESLVSPLFWFLAISVFVLFFAASRLNSKSLRILLFWIPAIAISTFGFGIVSLFTYMWIHFRRG
jgi:uncharacterized Tic20 family protein